MVVRIGIGEEDQEGTKVLMDGLADMQIAEGFRSGRNYSRPDRKV
jgi:hypothetical protein